MTSLVIHEVISFLSRSQFLSVSQIETLEREHVNELALEPFIENLVARSWITSFQGRLLAAGDGEKLVVGPYRLQQTLGEGGMGMVYLAHQPKLDRLVALKVIRPQVLAVKPEVVFRFHREAKAIARVTHPNMVILYDADEVDGMNYIAMEYVDGMSLEKMVRLNGPLMIRQAADYMRQAACGLQHAMECGLVHRDIKPSNLLVAKKQVVGTNTTSSVNRRPALVTPRDREMSSIVASDNNSNARMGSWGTIKILDMGLARLHDSLEDEEGMTPLTRAGALLGTPDFIAPEQARDARKADFRADIYSLGCTFYFLLTGRPPFPGGTDVQKLLKHQSERPAPIDELRPHIPTSIATIVRKMMEKKPQHRHATPQQLVDELTHYLEGPPTPLPGTVVMDAARDVTPKNGTPGVPPIEAHYPGDKQAQTDTPRDLQVPKQIQSPGNPGTTMRTQYGNMGGGIVPLADLPEIRSHANVQAHRGAVNALAISPNRLLVASGGIDGRVRIWDFSGLEGAEMAGLPRPATEIQCLAFAPSEPFLVLGGRQQKNCRVWRWDWDDSRVFDWGTFEEEKRGVNAMTFSADGKLFAAGISSAIAYWKVQGRDAKSRTVLKGHTQTIRSIAFSPDRRLLITGDEGKVTKLWGFGWLGVGVKASLEGHSDTVSSASFSPSGKRLITASFDKQIILWDPLLPSIDTAVRLVGHSGSVRVARYLPDGVHVISLGDDGHVVLWDVSRASKVNECRLDLPAYVSVAVSNDGRLIALGGLDGKVYVYDMSGFVPEQPPEPMPE